MGRLASDHPGMAVHPNPPRKQDPAVDAADGCKTQIPVVGDAGHHQADFIHMGSEQHPVGRLLPALEAGDDAAEPVHRHLHLRRGGGQNPQDMGTHLVFPAGYARQGTELFQRRVHTHNRLPSPSISCT